MNMFYCKVNMCVVTIFIATNIYRGNYLSIFHFVVKKDNLSPCSQLYYRWYLLFHTNSLISNSSFIKTWDLFQKCVIILLGNQIFLVVFVNHFEISEDFVSIEGKLMFSHA